MLTVVLDDDPTGTQAASDVSVLLDWSTDAIVDTLAAEGSVYLQTNTRAVEADTARDLARAIRTDLDAAERALGQPILVVLRGDSTLRGHVFTESDVFGGSDGRILFVPAFPQGGRRTINAVHCLTVDGVETPVGQTEFARDPVFGYHSSNLVDWVREKGNRRAIPVSLNDLRETHGQAVANALAAAGRREVVVPDVETDEDVKLIHRGLMLAVTAGTHVVVRSAATLAAVCADRLSAGYLVRPVEWSGDRALVVCGSHTNAATAQLSRLTAHLGVEPVVVATDDAFADPAGAGQAAAVEARRQLETSGVAIIATERTRRPADDTLRDGALVMSALIEATCQLVPAVGAVISKGGITSAEVARVAFGAATAHVRGQVAPGISVWDLGEGDRRGVQVVVPGNVGEVDALVDVAEALRIKTRTRRP